MASAPICPGPSGGAKHRAKEDRNRNMIVGGRDGAGRTRIKAAAAPVSPAAALPRHYATGI